MFADFIYSNSVWPVPFFQGISFSGDKTYKTEFFQMSQKKVNDIIPKAIEIQLGKSIIQFMLYTCEV